MKKLSLFLFISFSILFAKAQCNEPTEVQLQSVGYGWLELAISWQSNGMDLWDIEHGEEGFTPTGVPTIEDHLYNYIYFNEFLPPTSGYYDIYIRSDCGTSTSGWVGPYTFYNYCLDGATGVFTNFDNEFIPDCWMESDTGTPQTGIGLYGSSSWEQDYFANDSNNSLAAKININGTDINEWLVLPIMQGFWGLKDTPYLYLHFYIALTEANAMSASQLGTDDLVQLVISYDFGQTWYIIKTWDTNSMISNTGEQLEIYRENFTDNGIDMFEKAFLVAFFVSSGENNDANIDFFIDNLEVFPPFEGSVSDFKNFGLTIYPNPVESTLYIEAKQPIDYIEIYNQLGQKVKEVALHNENIRLDLSDLNGGIYHLQFHLPKTVLSTKILKQN